MNSDHFISVFDKHYKEIFRYIFYKINNKEIAEDLTSEVFIKALENISKYNNKKASERTWLFRIARNVVIDEYRKKKFVSYDEEKEESEVDLNLNMESQILGSKTILSCLNKLKIDEKELIILRYIEEFEIKEISEIINKKYSATKVAIHRSIEKLRKII